MIQTSELYKSIMAGPHDTQAVVGLHGHNGTVYWLDHTLLSALFISRGAFSADSPECGNCVMSSVELSAIGRYPMPPAGLIEVWAYITDGNRTSEWIKQGVFYCDQNTYVSDHGQVSTKITGYDSLGFASQLVSLDMFQWPCTGLQLIQTAAGIIWADIDPAIIPILSNITLQKPDDGGYTLRELMGAVAGVAGGNFVVNKSNQLTLIRIGDARADTSYIVDELRRSITVGGERILAY